MMKRAFSMLAVIVAGMLGAAGIGNAAQQIYTVTQLTNNETADTQPEINTQGWAVWQEIVDSDYEIMLRGQGGNITNISNNNFNDGSAHINQHGDVVWEVNDGNDTEIFLYTRDGGRIQVTNNSNDDISVVINDQTTIAWAGIVDGKWEIFKFDASAFPLLPPVQITDFAQSKISNNEMPQINNSGIIVWQGTDNNNVDSVGQPAPPDKEIFIYHPQIGVQQLTNNNFDDIEPHVNNKGDVVWVGSTGKGMEIYYYHAISGKITTLTDNSFDDRNPKLNDRGDVTWLGESGAINNINDTNASPDEIYHYNARTGVITRITNNQRKDGNPNIDQAGDVVWEGSDGNDMEIFMYDASTNSISQVTNNAVDDVSPFNANGKIVFLTSSPDKEVVLAVPSLTADSDKDGITISGGDCDDLDPAIKPGAAEFADNIDNNCNGQIDEGFTQVCGNGKREGTESCDDGNKIDIDGCSADCSSPVADYYMIKQITNSSYRQIQPHTNYHDDIVWRGNDGMDDEIYFYDNTSKTTTQLSNNTGSDRMPAINENGDIAWVCDEDGTDDDICIIPKNGTKIILQALPPAMSGKDDNVVLAENGDLAWIATVGGHDQIYFYDHTKASIKALTTSAVNKANPRIASSDTNTFVTWQSPTGRDTQGLDNEIFLYNHAAGLTTQINNDNAVDDYSPVVNSLGDVAWIKMTGTDVWSNELMFYDASTGTILQLTDDKANPSEDFYPEIATVNGDTYVAWARSVPASSSRGQTDYHVMLYKNLVTPEYIELTNNSIIIEHISINNNGDVAWDAHDGHDREIIIYDNTKRTITQVTSNTLMDSYPNIGANKRLAWIASSAPGLPEQIFQAIPIQCSDADHDGWSTCQGDCNDADSSIYPGAPELCDNKNNNCDALGLVDEIKITYYRDQDGDGYGNAQVFQTACSQPAGYVTNPGDCNDTKANIKPGGVEVCEFYGGPQVDNNCDGMIYDPALYSTYWVDSDGDGYGDGNTNSAIQVCAGAPSAYALAANGKDLDDKNSSCYPGSIAGTCSVQGKASYLPTIYDSETWSSWSAIVNVGTASSLLDLFYRDTTGLLTNTKHTTLNQAALYSNTARNDVGGAMIGSLEIKAGEPTVGLNISQNTQDGHWYSVYGSITPGKSIIMPHLNENTAASWTGTFTITNTGTTSADVTMRFYDMNGQLALAPAPVIQIPPGAQYRKRVMDVVGDGFKGSLHIDASQPVTATFDQGNTADFRYASYGSLTPATTIYYPHANAIDPWYSWFLVTNASDANATVSVLFYNFDGTLNKTVPLTLAPYASYGNQVWKMASMGFRGYIKAVSNQPVVGIQTFNNYSDGRYGAYGTPMPGNTIYFPYLIHRTTPSQGNWFAVVNVGTATTSITMDCFDLAGGKVKTVSATINTNQSYGNAVKNVCGAEFAGSVKVTSLQPIVGYTSFNDYVSGGYGAMEHVLTPVP